MADVESVIRKFIVREIMLENDETMLSFNDQLVPDIIDSAGIVELVVFLDEEFHVSIPPEDLVPEYFETIQTVSDYLKTKASPAT